VTRDSVLSLAPGLVLAGLSTPAPKASKRVLNFFTARVNNNHTRETLCAQGRNPGPHPASARQTEPARP